MNWPLVIAILACSGFVQGLTGFGFGLVSMSLLPSIMDLRQAAAIGTFYGLLVTIATFVKYFRDYNWRLGIPFLVSMCVGVPIGVYFLDKSPDNILIKTLGAFMVLFAARELFFKREPKSIHPGLSVPMGLFSGSLSGAFNLGGIPTATYAYAHPWTRGQIIAFLQTMLLLSSTLRLFLYGKFGYLQQFSWSFGAVVAVPLFGAMFLGNYVMNRIHPKHMRRGIFIFVGLAGIYYLLKHEDKKEPTKHSSFPAAQMTASNSNKVKDGAVTELAGKIDRFKINSSPVNYTIHAAQAVQPTTPNWNALSWTCAETLEIKNFRPESSSHHPQTLARLTYDRLGIHGIFKVRDQFVRCIRTNYFDEVWKDSCVEFFVQPKADKGYFNFEFNCGGGFLCCYITNPERVPGGFKEFIKIPADIGKQIQVTSSLPKIVDPEITTPTEWTLQFYIPFSVMETYVGPLSDQKGQTWRGNFFKCVEECSHPHWASWSPVDEFNFHLPRCFGTLEFQ